MAGAQCWRVGDGITSRGAVFVFSTGMVVRAEHKVQNGVQSPGGRLADRELTPWVRPFRRRFLLR